MKLTTKIFAVTGLGAALGLGGIVGVNIGTLMNENWGIKVPSYGVILAGSAIVAFGPSYLRNKEKRKREDEFIDGFERIITKYPPFRQN